MTMEQLLFPEKYEQATYQILPVSEFATSFIEGQFYKRQQFHCYSRLIENVARDLPFIELHTL
jgi:hypothetical protein